MIIPSFMIRQGEQKHITEEYVSVPPALIITDETGSIWTLGFKYGPAPNGEFAFNVLKNGIDTGEFASRIERRRKGIRIFTANGWKQMKTDRIESFCVYGIGVRSIKSFLPTLLNVSIYFDDLRHISCAQFIVDSVKGGIFEKPITCNSGQWLLADVRPINDGVQVVGYLGEKNLREIPILRSEP